jgi:cytidylate kinase
MIITLDGPTASGKSTVAQQLARQMNYFCVCTGFLYRGLAYKAKKMGYDEHTIEQLLTEKSEQLFDMKNVLYHYDYDSGARIFVDGDDVTEAIDTPAIGSIASVLGAYEQVRSVLNMLQHAIAGSWDQVVVEGRDSGSAVFPFADYKFFITASINARAQRWQKKQAKHGVVMSVLEAEKHIAARDVRDENRSLSPLIIPDGAYVLDTSDISIGEAVAWIQEHLQQCVGDNG